MKNNLEKLTSLAGKSYHGNMENKDDKPLEQNKKTPENTAQNGIPKSFNSAGENKNENARLREAEKINKKKAEEEEMILVRKKLREPNKEGEKKEFGIFDILFEFLKGLFGAGFSKEKLADMLENSEAMRGVQAYWRIKPQNKWNETDYGRVIFMLSSDGSKEADTLKKRLYKEAERNGIPSEKVLAKNAEIAKEHSGSLPSEGGERGGSYQKRKEEMVHSAIKMNTELWATEGKAPDLSEKEWTGLEREIESLVPQGEHASKDQADRVSLLKQIRRTRYAQRMGRVMAGELEISGGSGERDKEEGGGKEKKGKPVEYMSAEEKQEYYESESLKRLGDISANTMNMLKELQDLNKSIKSVIGDYLKEITDHPGDPKITEKYIRTYVTNRTREMNIESQLAETLSKGEKRVLGGEKDHHLYVGNIHEVIDERMKRIEYFIAGKTANKEIDFKTYDPENKSVLNQDAYDIKGDKKEIEKRQDFLKRAKDRYEEFEGKGILAKQEGVYFQEIQRWVGNILENSVYGYEGKSGNLTMPEDVYQQFKEIKEMKAYVYQYDEGQDEYKEKLLGAVKKLREEKFLDYFKGRDEKGKAVGISYLNLEGKDIRPEDAYIGSSSMGYPSSIEATMLLIADDRGAEYRTGAEHELIDASGKFHQENFIYWMRKEMNKLVDWDPWSQIDPMRGITFKAGFSQISLFDILFLPQYTQHQEIEMSGDVTGWYKEGKEASITTGWGEKKDHPDMTYDTRVNRILIDEPWLAGVEHNDWVALNSITARGSIEEYLKAKQQIANSNNYTRSGLWTRSLMLASHDGHGGKDTENYLKKKKQGRMGEAVNAGRLAYRYLTEFTEFHMEKEKGKALGVREDNMFYKALDADGSSVFLTSLAESALGMADPGARREIKEIYRGFILERIKEMGEDYGKKAGADPDKVNQLVKVYKDKINTARPDEIKISFDTFDKLVELQMKLETVAMGKTVVTAKEKRDYGLEDKVVVKEEVEKSVKELMMKNMYKDDGSGFLNKLIGVKIPEWEEDEKGSLSKTGKNVEIGKINLFTDGKGRIVTKKECMEICGVKEEGDINKKNIITMAEIIEENSREIVGDGDKKISQFAKDEEDLGTIKEYVETMEAVGDLEEKYELARRLGDQKKLDEINKELAKKKKELVAGDGKSGKKEIYDNNIKNKVYENIFKRRERLGLGMVTKVANIDRKNLNFWRSTRPMEESARKLIQDALMKSLGATYGLDKEEQLYAHHRIWYPLEHMEIAAFNNTSGVPGAIHQSSYSRTMEMRNAAMGLGTMSGNDETVEEIKALRLPSLFERVRIKKRGEGMPGGNPEHMMIEILQNGKGREMMPRWLRKLEDNPDDLYEIGMYWEHADYIDGLSKAEDARKVIVEEDPELGSFHEIVKRNAFGVLEVDHSKARKLFNAYWNNIRLIYNSHQINYEDKIAVDGREISIRDHMFGKKTRETQEIMRDYYSEMARKLEKREPKEAEAYKRMAKEIMDKPALAAMMDMVTAGIHEHMSFSNSYQKWTPENLDEIADILNEYFHQPSVIGQEGNDVMREKMPKMMPYELFNLLLGAQHGDSMEGFTFWALWRIFWAGIVEGVKQAEGEWEDEIVRVKKIYKGG